MTTLQKDFENMLEETKKYFEKNEDRYRQFGESFQYGIEFWIHASPTGSHGYCTIEGTLTWIEWNVSGTDYDTFSEVVVKPTIIAVLPKDLDEVNNFIQDISKEYEDKLSINSTLFEYVEYSDVTDFEDYLFGFKVSDYIF